MNKGLMVLCLVLSAPVLAKTGYVDEYQKQIDLKVNTLAQKYKKECNGKRNSTMCKFDAVDKARYEYEDDYRGEDKYSSEHYGNLSRDQAAAKLHELIRLYDVVKKDDRNPESWPGKMHPLMVDAEINYIIKKYFPTRIDTCGKICAELLLRQIGK